MRLLENEDYCLDLFSLDDSPPPCSDYRRIDIEDVKDLYVDGVINEEDMDALIESCIVNGGVLVCVDEPIFDVQIFYDKDVTDVTSSGDVFIATSDQRGTVNILDIDDWSTKRISTPNDGDCDD